MRSLVLAVAAFSFVLTSGRVALAAPAAPAATSAWPGEELPLQLPVRTPADLTVKEIAERQYLIFNLLVRGKLAWDAGDYVTAVAKWEALLRVGGLDAEVDKAIRPLAREARAKAGLSPGAPLPPPPPVAVAQAPSAAPATPPAAGEARSAPSVVTVGGSVSGGGPLGPGGAVVWLKRATGETPRPSAAKGKVVTQRNKAFIPRVLAVPVGTKVDFRNEDEIFHNVFSLSRPNDFDTGLYKQGASYSQVFHKAGPVQLLCNIHASMIGYVYVVDTPYYAQADISGAFTIKGVPPGEYEISVWHEGSSKDFHQKITVGPEGIRGMAIKIGGDRRLPAFIPDKSGKPRQSQLGY